MSEPLFLVVRLGSLGDIVHTFPAVSALRESFPYAQIVWLTHPRWKPLVESSSLASEIWTVDTRSFASIRETLKHIRQIPWTASVDYQGLWKSAALPFFGGISKRIGFSSHTIREFGVPILYNERVHATQKHIAAQNGELSIRAGASEDSAPFTLSIPPEAQAATRGILREAQIDRYIVLSPGGGWLSKCWPAERFGALCQKIDTQLGLRCVVNYGPGEESLANTVRANSGKAAPLLYDGGLQELMAILRNALCIVGGDTGPLHLAVAIRTNAVGLFGPTDPDRNGPYPNDASPRGVVSETRPHPATASLKNIVLRSRTAPTTLKRGNQPDPSILELTVEEVFEAVRRCIGAAA
ncbi:MAG TPA: glycosyltransferase family 9 protein [Candidatus Acidoferrum sp.]|jgi:ADP-heptose:LPS heptosyltransferase